MRRKGLTRRFSAGGFARTCSAHGLSLISRHAWVRPDPAPHAGERPISAQRWQWAQGAHRHRQVAREALESPEWMPASSAHRHRQVARGKLSNGRGSSAEAPHSNEPRTANAPAAASCPHEGGCLQPPGRIRAGWVPDGPSPHRDGTPGALSRQHLGHAAGNGGDAHQRHTELHQKHGRHRSDGAEQQRANECDDSRG